MAQAIGHSPGESTLYRFAVCLLQLLRLKVTKEGLFRYGCDFLRRAFSDFSLRRSEFNQALQFLSLY